MPYRLKTRKTAAYFVTLDLFREFCNSVCFYDVRFTVKISKHNRSISTKGKVFGCVRLYLWKHELALNTEVILFPHFPAGASGNRDFSVKVSIHMCNNSLFDCSAPFDSLSWAATLLVKTNQSTGWTWSEIFLHCQHVDTCMDCGCCNYRPWQRLELLPMHEWQFFLWGKITKAGSPYNLDIHLRNSVRFRRW